MRDPWNATFRKPLNGYLQYSRALHDADGNHLANVGENTSIAVAVGVQHATDLIDANQIGFELPTG